MCDLQWFWFPILRDDQNGYIVETKPKRKIATELVCQSSEFLFSLFFIWFDLIYLIYSLPN